MCPDADFDPKHITEEERSLAQEIMTLLEDKDKMKHYQDMALKRAADYTAESYIEKIRAWAEI